MQIIRNQPRVNLDIARPKPILSRLDHKDIETQRKLERVRELISQQKTDIIKRYISNEGGFIGSILNGSIVNEQDSDIEQLLKKNSDSVTNTDLKRLAIAQLIKTDKYIRLTKNLSEVETNKLIDAFTKESQKVQDEIRRVTNITGRLVFEKEKPTIYEEAVRELFDIAIDMTDEELEQLRLNLQNNPQKIATALSTVVISQSSSASASAQSTPQATPQVTPQNTPPTTPRTTPNIGQPQQTPNIVQPQQTPPASPRATPNIGQPPQNNILNISDVAQIRAEAVKSTDTPNNFSLRSTKDPKTTSDINVYYNNLILGASQYPIFVKLDLTGNTISFNGFTYVELKPNSKKEQILKDRKIVNYNEEITPGFLYLLFAINTTKIKEGQDKKTFTTDDVNKLRKLFKAYELINVTNNKYNYIINDAIKVGLGIIKKKGLGIIYYKSVDELKRRLTVLMGQVDAGNTSKKVKNEISNIADRLLKDKDITKTKYNAIYKKVLK